ncbi:DUF5131 family protein [uncultured Muribaculum sp.]|uniref:DUF5131 family protein n=1 Tax=uncultured Muribaculum sp. TaxID=1918613 RepID=UPI0025EFA0E3|nr:DUF5131 family protein [uncultured Muribaculum sp.]
MPVWNPWHGCHKTSEGCRHCYVYREDAARGVSVPTNEVHRTAAFNLPLRRDRHKNLKFPSGTHFWLCFTSDLLIEEADEWRADIWSMIRQRSDCHFTFFTKRIHRLGECLPQDWGDGYDNVTIGCTVENQDRADYRMPIFLSMPIKHRLVVVEPMIGPVDLSLYLDPGIIDDVSIGGESGKYGRTLDFEWVKELYRQCREAGVACSFHQTGSYLRKDGRVYHIPREHQHSQARMALLSITFPAR